MLHTRHHGTTPSDELVALVTECGASGWALPFLGLGPRVERLLQAIRLDELHPGLARALAFLAPTSPVSADERGVRLTSRELTLVELLPTHLSYAEMGEQLFLSVNTVKSNLKALYRKLDADHACRGGGGQPARRPDLSAVSDRHGLRRRTPSRNTQNCHTSGTRSTETTPNSSTNGRPSFQ